MTMLVSRFKVIAAALVCAGWMMNMAPAAAASPDGFEDLAERLLPAVVNVSTSSKVDTSKMPQIPGFQFQFPEGPDGANPFEDFFKEFYEQFRGKGLPQMPQAPQKEQKVTALGSGFIIDAANGYIVTNNHVIKDADEIKVILHDNTSVDATLVGTDEKTDLAVLQIKTSVKLTEVKWGDSDTSRVGSWVLAIGNPFGLGGTVTAGIVSARQRDINAGPYDDFIQTDASINRGNSGGPMFNMKGEVVGVNTAIFSPSGGSIGIGFAVPSNIAQNVVAQLVKYGKTKRGWLGVKIQNVTPEIAESLGLGKPHGALVAEVTKDGPSDKAGIQNGDVILTFDGHEVETSQKLPRMVAETEVGKRVDVGVWRKKEKISVTVTLGQLEKAEEDGKLSDEAPPSAPVSKADTTESPDLGISLAVLTDAARDQYGLEAQTKGVLITEVKPGGPGAEKGLAEGDVIVEFDQQEVSTPADVAQKVEEAKKAKRNSVLLFIARKQDMRFVALKLTP